MNSDDYDIEEDPELYAEAFQRGLRQNSVRFLTELQEMVMDDYELVTEQRAITIAFDMLRKYIHNNGTEYIDMFELADLSELGLDGDTINRIGFLAFQRNYKSPEATASTSLRHMNRLSQSKTPSEIPEEDEDEYGDENFEEESQEIGDDDVPMMVGSSNSVETLRNNYMSDQKQQPALPSTAATSSSVLLREKEEEEERYRRRSQQSKSVDNKQIPFIHHNSNNNIINNNNVPLPTVSSSLQLPIGSSKSNNNNNNKKNNSWIVNKQWRLGEK